MDGRLEKAIEHAGLQVDDDERSGGGRSGVGHGRQDSGGGGWVKDWAWPEKQLPAQTALQFSDYFKALAKSASSSSWKA
jgi:hypothetical protein